MFSSEHQIWKIAYCYGEIDDWLPYAEEMIRKWETQNSDEVKFPGTFEIMLTAILLKDDLLPASARAAFAEVMLEAINEAIDNKLKLKTLHIYPPKPGRKKNRAETLSRYHEVKDLIQAGMTITKAYDVVAEKNFKSPDTIRRDYERIVKKIQAKGNRGKQEMISPVICFNRKRKMHPS